MMDNPPGTSAIVEAAAEELAQTLFSVADVPLARTDELLAAISGPAVRAVLEMRIEQIVKHGHTAERDAMLPPGTIAADAKAFIVTALALISGLDREVGEYKRGQRCLAKAAAMCLAAIDRVEMAIAEQGGA